MSKCVVLLPSVQRNRGLDGYTEGEGMRIVCEHAHDMLLGLPGFEVELFWPGYEDGPDHRMLRRQQEQAEMWLRAQPGPYADKVVLNLHSGSGERSRVLGIHGLGMDGKGSRALAAAVAPAVGRAMRVREVKVVHRLGPVDYSQYIFYREQHFTSALIECGSHGNARDTRILSDTPEVVARGIVEGIRAYFAAARPRSRSGVVWGDGRFEVRAAGAISRSAPTRAGRVLRGLPTTVLMTDGYTEAGQKVAGSSCWYHLARASGYGWVHESAGRYLGPGKEEAS